MKKMIRFAACLNVAVMASPIPAAFATAAINGAAANTRPPPNAGICAADDVLASRLRSGDRITVTMYERVDPADNDRAPARSAFPNYRLRAEVSGDFIVGEDGVISIPILGQIPAAGKTADELRDAIARPFSSLLGHVGIVTIAIAERQPIYVDGVVKNPGAYKYTPGLTVFHALSLAGGFEEIKLESHQVLVTTAQEAVTGEQARETLMRLLAREAVLRAELEATPVSIPRELIDLAGASEAEALVAAQVSERKTVVKTNEILRQQQAQLVEAHNQALEARVSEMKLIDASIDARDQRLKGLATMASKGIIADALIEGVKAEYLDTLARKQDLSAAKELSQTQLAEAQSTIEKLKLDERFALQHELGDVKLQIAQQSAAYRSHLAVAAIVNKDPNLSGGGTPMAFDLVRRIGDHVATVTVDGSCLLQPGDLIRVHQPGSIHN
jgi:protein involved in polysaccharide export with SLBB domain